MSKVAVILSGCGNRDGSELQETLSLLLALDRRNVEYQCFAPQGDFAVFNYVGDERETGERRNIMAEAARVARGDIRPLADYRVADFDALALPGGMGAARNLSNYASEGASMCVMAEVETAIREAYKAQKPIVAMCIAPMVLAKVLGEYSVNLTLGGRNGAADVAEQLGAHAMVCGPTDVCIDRRNRVLTTPAYMAATRISQIFSGADNLVEALMEFLS